MREQLEKIREEALNQIEASEALEKLNEIRVAYLGKKGELTNLLKGMKDVAPEDRPKVGQMVNEVRSPAGGKAGGSQDRPCQKGQRGAVKARGHRRDPARPRRTRWGTAIPTPSPWKRWSASLWAWATRWWKVRRWSTTRYNFEKLNIPKGHPARDEQDTFYINDTILLRSQTSPVQVRTMEQGKLPIRMIAPGRVFRSDEVDATHSPSFHQIEGLVIDKNITFADLKGTLAEFAKELFGPETKVKFRPHHFPFTEPSAEVDVTCFKCGGKGCRFCKGSGWIEILGCGMVHPHVLEMCNIDPEEYSGFAFGVGLERIALLKYEIDDMRLLYENDIRFLKQF